MKTSLILSTILLLGYLTVTSMVSQNQALEWLSDSSVTANVLRGLLIALLSLLLIYHPPRKSWVRGVLALGSTVSFGIGSYYLLHFHINIIDVLLYFEAGIILALEAIEVKKVRLSQPKTPVYQVPVRVY